MWTVEFGREMEGGLTSSELAGFGVGTLLLWATLSAPKLDALFSASQRRSVSLYRILNFCVYEEMCNSL